MTPDEWMEEQPGFVRLIEEALEQLNRDLDERYRDVFGEDPTRCMRCNRIMVPRRIFYAVPIEKRYSAFVPVGKGDAGECHACRVTQRRNNGRPAVLPEAEVSRLRALVGFRSSQGRKVV